MLDIPDFRDKAIIVIEIQFLASEFSDMGGENRIHSRDMQAQKLNFDLRVLEGETRGHTHHVVQVDHLIIRIKTGHRNIHRSA